MMDVKKNYREAVGKVDQLYFKEGTVGKMDNDIWYYHMNEAELLEKQAVLKDYYNLLNDYLKLIRGIANEVFYLG